VRVVKGTIAHFFPFLESRRCPNYARSGKRLILLATCERRLPVSVDQIMQTVEALDGEEFHGRLSPGVLVGGAYKPSKGKGATVAASRHVWADSRDTLPDFAFSGGQGPGQGCFPVSVGLVSWGCMDLLPVSVALASPTLRRGHCCARCKRKRTWR